MQSLHGIYENGKIKLLQPLPDSLPESATVLITFVDEGAISGDSPGSAAANQPVEADVPGVSPESMREFERVKAHGNITIIDRDEQFTFPLNDYSQGGLSFISDRVFEVGHLISAGIIDPTNPDLVLMNYRWRSGGLWKMKITATG